MDSETLAEYRYYAESGRFSSVSIGVLCEILAYVDELEASRARLRRVVRPIYLLQNAQTRMDEVMGVNDIEIAMRALQPGDLRDGEEPCDTPS